MEPGTADQFSENKRKNTKIKENNDIKKIIEVSKSKVRFKRLKKNKIKVTTT